MDTFEPGRKKTKAKKTSLMEVDLEKRMFAPDETIISDSMYNLTIGLTIALGFAIDFVMAFFFGRQIMSIPYIAVIIAYFVLTLGGAFIVHRSSSAFVSGLAFMVMAVGMGLLLTFFLNAYELSSVYLAFGITCGITVVMTILGTIFPAFFLSIGKTLGITLIIVIIAEVACLFLFPGALRALDYGVIILFCGYIGYDWARAQRYAKTLDNAVDSAADMYLDIVNIFIRILEITGKTKD